jgi:hypothetical protein
MTGLLGLAVVLLPAIALACPACARDTGAYAALLVGAMIAAPYVVVALVIHAIRAAGVDRR